MFIRYGSMNYKKITVLILFILNSGCGYHLRGLNNNSYVLPYKLVYLDCAGVSICHNLQVSIQSQHLTTIIEDINKSDAIIKITNEEKSKVPQNYNIAGRIASYRLTYQVSVKVLDKKNPNHDIKFNTYATSVMNYNDSTILANDTNEKDIWDFLYRNATSQLINKLIYFN